MHILKIILTIIAVIVVLNIVGFVFIVNRIGNSKNGWEG